MDYRCSLCAKSNTVECDSKLVLIMHHHNRCHIFLHLWLVCFKYRDILQCAVYITCCYSISKEWLKWSSKHFGKMAEQFNITISPFSKQLYTLQYTQFVEHTLTLLTLFATDLAQHYLVKANITAIRRVRKSDNNRIARLVKHCALWLRSNNHHFGYTLVKCASTFH